MDQLQNEIDRLYIESQPSKADLELSQKSVSNFEVCISEISHRVKELQASKVLIVGNAANGNLGTNFKKLYLCLVVDEYINASSLANVDLLQRVIEEM
jgi:hypothetical protein